MTAAELRQHYYEVRKRLIKPPNRVYDQGIDLQRGKPGIKPKEEVIKEVTPNRPVPKAGDNKTKPSSVVPQQVRADLPGIPLNVILKVLCKHYNQDIGSILGRSREYKYLMPRHLLFYFLTEHPRISVSAAGRQLGFDHSTIIYAHQKITMAMIKHPAIKELVTFLEAEILALHHR